MLFHCFEKGIKHCVKQVFILKEWNTAVTTATAVCACFAVNASFQLSGNCYIQQIISFITP